VDSGVRLQFTARFAAAAAWWVLVALALARVAISGRHAAGLVVLALTVAAVAAPSIERVQRRIPRGAAAPIVVLVGLLIVGTLATFGAQDLGAQRDELLDALPARIDGLADDDWRVFLTDLDASERLASALDGLPARVLTGTQSGPDAVQRTAEYLLVAFLAIYALLGGGDLVRRLLRLASPEHGARWWPAVRGAALRAGRYLGRTTAAATVGGVAAWAVANALDLPGPAALGLWVAIWSIVPFIGAPVGYAPLVLLAGVEGPIALASAVLVGLAWVVLDWMLQRFAARDAVAPGALLTAVALAIGLELGWLTGALSALFVACFALALIEERGRIPTEPTKAVSVALPPSEHQDSPDTIAGPEPAPGFAGGTSGRTMAGTSGTTMGGTAGGTMGGTVLDGIAPRSGVLGVAVAVAVVGGLSVLGAASPVPARVVLGLAVGVALHQVVDLLTRHSPIPRRVAVGIVVATLLCGAALFAALALPSVIDNTRDLTADLPAVIDDVGTLPVIGDRLSESGFLEDVESFVDDLPAQATSNPSVLGRAADSLGDGLSAAFWVLLIAVGAMADGPRVVRTGLSALPESRRLRAGEILRTAYDVVGRYAAGSLAIAAMAGAFIFVAALVLGIPLAALCAVWAMVWNFVPQIGGFVGGGPFLLLALTQGATTALIAAIAFVVYWQIENRVVQPVITSKAVDLSPFVAMTAVLLGAAAFGVVGAVLATPFVGAAKALFESTRPPAV